MNKWPRVSELSISGKQRKINVMDGLVDFESMRCRQKQNLWLLSRV